MKFWSEFFDNIKFCIELVLWYDRVLFRINTLISLIDAWNESSDIIKLCLE